MAENTVDTVNIEVKYRAGQAAPEVKALVDALRQASPAAGEAADRLRETADAMEALANRSGRSQNNFHTFITGLASGIYTLKSLYHGAKRVAGVLGSWFNESNAYIENVNLFTVAMGESADEAMRYAEQVQNLMGIDISDWIKNQGVFQQMSEGFGIASDKAAIMSKNLTQLGYDLSSFFNTDVQTAMQKLQSGMSGQVKGLKAYGINLSVAALQETALAHGINTSVRAMSEADRAMLRYVTVMERTSKIQGDMARTIITPANAMRILQAALVRVKREFGNIISVLATKFIPYVILAAKALAAAAQSLANLFGFKLPEIDYSGLSASFSDAEDSSGGISDNLGKAAGKAKKLKDYMMGFDELNVINPDDASVGSGGGSVGGGGAGGLGDVSNLFENLPQYDFLKGLIDQSGIAKDKLDKIKDVVGLVAGGITGWSVGAKLFGANLALGPSVIIGMLVGRLVELTIKNDQFREGLGKILEAAKIVFKGVADALPFTEFELFGLELDGMDVFLTGLGTALLFTNPVLGGIVLAFEAATIGIRALGKGFEECLDHVEIFGEGISDVTKEKLQPFIDKFNDLDSALKEIHWTDGIISKEDLVDIQTKFDELTQTTKTALEEERDTTLAWMEENKESYGEHYAEYVEDIKASYQERISAIDENEKLINDILIEHANSGKAITEEEWTEINRIMSTLQGEGVNTLSETKTEATSIMENWSKETKNLDTQTWSKVLQNAQQAKKESIENANTLYDTIVAKAQKQYEMGTISYDVYTQMVSDAEKARDDSIAAAETQYSTMLETAETYLGDMYNTIDITTGKIKTNFDVQGEEWNKTNAKWLDAMGRTTDDKTGSWRKSYEAFRLGENTAADTWWKKMIILYDKGMEDANGSFNTGTSVWGGTFARFRTNELTSFGTFFTNLWTKITNFFSGEKWKTLGQDAGKGIGTGLNSTVTTTAQNYKTKLLKKMEEKMDINSPSKVMRDEIGIYLGEGIVEGMEDGTEESLYRSNMIENMLNQLSKQFNEQFNRLISIVENSVNRLISVVQQAFNRSDWKTMGEDAVDGLMEGLDTVDTKISEWNSDLLKDTQKTVDKAAHCYGLLGDRIVDIYSLSEEERRTFFPDFGTELSIGGPSVPQWYLDEIATSAEDVAGYSFDEIASNIDYNDVSKTTTINQTDQAMQSAINSIQRDLAKMTGLSGDINVYLSGKQITAEVEKTQRENGISILGGALLA